MLIFKTKVGMRRCRISIVDKRKQTFTWCFDSQHAIAPPLMVSSFLLQEMETNNYHLRERKWPSVVDVSKTSRLPNATFLFIVNRSTSRLLRSLRTQRKPHLLHKVFGPLGPLRFTVVRSAPHSAQVNGSATKARLRGRCWGFVMRR